VFLSVQISLFVYDIKHIMKKIDSRCYFWFFVSVRLINYLFYSFLTYYIVLHRSLTCCTVVGSSGAKILVIVCVCVAVISGTAVAVCIALKGLYIVIGLVQL